MTGKYLQIWLLPLLLLLGSQQASGSVLDVTAVSDAPIGQFLSFLQEKQPLTLGEARQAFSDGRFTVSRRDVPDFGIGSDPVWLALTVRNPQPGPVTRSLQLKTSWLDRVDVYFVTGDEVITSYHTGDALPFRERPVESRYFRFDHAFGPGETRVFLRVETSDPLVLPLYLTSDVMAQAGEVREAYGYGLLYGAIFILIAYNFMLFVGMKSRRYLYYGVYLGMFVLMNMAYTGHGYQWFWPEWPRWQYWSNPVLMMLYSMAGLAFALRFLDLRLNFPRLHRTVIVGCLSFGALLILAILLDAHGLALGISFVFVFVFTITMLLLGAVSFLGGNRAAKFFLIASTTHAITASITALAVWGFIPYTVLTFHAVEAGMILDAVLINLALVDQYRILQSVRLDAEKLARVDPLTGLNNRRAFYEIVSPLWSAGQRKGHDMSLLLLDLDNFKQINDTHGHARGDIALKKVAGLIADNLRVSDVPARWGGEEFIIFLGETRLEEAEAIAQRFRSRLADSRFEVDGATLQLTTSIGVAHVSDVAIDIDDLINVADRCLYEAKDGGRNRVCAREVEPRSPSLRAVETTAGIAP